MKNLLTILVAGSCLFLAGCSTDDGSGDTGSSKGRGAGGYEAMQKLGARTGGDVDCSAFKSQRQAQRYLLPGDPNGLDADGDGRACASLPCPCAEVKVQRTPAEQQAVRQSGTTLSLIHISEPTRLLSISYAVFCLKKKKPITKRPLKEQ